MVGRTPEYYGKKIEKREIQWVIVSILTPGALVLIGSGLSAILTAPLGSSGPHGLSEILFAFTSCAANNGSAFNSLNADTLYYNLLLGVVMLLGRLAIIIPSLALAGLFAQKKTTPASHATFSTETWLFAILLFSVVIIVGALTYFPALSLGPIIEQILMLRGVSA
jgi:K+-transporting ATPase ATPase A chain